MVRLTTLTNTLGAKRRHVSPIPRVIVASRSSPPSPPSVPSRLARVVKLMYEYDSGTSKK